MYCTMCGYPRDPSARFCCSCGVPFPARPEIRKPRRGWLPFALLAVMVLAGTVLFFLLPSEVPETTLSAPETTETSRFTEDCFTLENGVLRFDRSKYTDSPVLLVPSAINGQPVTAIGEGCFEGVSGITTIVLPGSVTLIGDRAFANCPDLRGLFIPEAVTAIGAEAFRGCESLESVYISTAVISIGTDAFEDCPNLIWLFYSGFYEEWIDLYPQPITPFTWAVCWDGEHLHAAQMS